VRPCLNLRMPHPPMTCHDAVAVELWREMSVPCTYARMDYDVAWPHKHYGSTVLAIMRKR
jgi:hypothetical protein